MKTLIPLAILALSSCGQEFPCANRYFLGTWTNEFGDTLTLDKSCHGTESYCGQEFDFDPNMQAGTMTFLVGTSNGNSGCAAVGSSRTCSYNSTATQLLIDCGGGQLTYTK